SLLPFDSHAPMHAGDPLVFSSWVQSTVVEVHSFPTRRSSDPLAVNITVAEPVAPQRSLKASKSLLQVTPLASVAVAPPLDSNQALSAAAFPFPSLSTELSEASAVISGSVVSNETATEALELSQPFVVWLT